MNWDAAGAVGEIIGAVAVVISVVYLAFQIRKQTDEAKLGATRELAEQSQQLLDRISSDLEFTEIYLKAVQNYKGLPDVERLWVALTFQRFFRVMEQQIYHIEKGNADPTYFDSFRRVFNEFLTYPGTQQWWPTASDLFSERFQNYVDEHMVKAKAKGYESSFKVQEGPLSDVSLESDA